MYDYWYRARHESNLSARKELAWEAFTWYVELGLRLSGNNNIDSLIHPFDGCEIIGEFELLEGDHIAFLRYLKRCTMHASISHCKKMMSCDVEMIPFSERGMPNYEEYQILFRQAFEARQS